jgi:hypothetical protein
MSARTIALQLRTLAAEPESQALLLAESSCLSGLVTLLHADQDEDVLILSLQALSLLASAGSHTHAPLVNQPGLLLALSLLTEKSSVVLKTMAHNVLAQLEGYINGNSNGSNTAAAPSASSASARGGRNTPQTLSRGGSRGNTRPTTPSGPRSSADATSVASSTVGAAFVPRYLNHVQFTVAPAAAAPANAAGVSSTPAAVVLDKAAAEAAEKALVAIKGVVSVAYNATGTSTSGSKLPTFTLYTSVRPATLLPLVQRALADLRNGHALTAALVTKGGAAAHDSTDKENQQENAPAGAPGYLNKQGTAAAAPAYLTKGATKPAASGAAGSAAPGYLTAGATASSTSGGSRALTTHATVSSASDSAQGLAARYQSNVAAKKKAAEAAAAATAAPGTTAKKGGILSNVASYFW